GAARAFGGQRPDATRAAAHHRSQPAADRQAISGPRPLYPPLAKAARVSGQVHLKAVIARDGTILDLRVIGGHPLLIPAALAAVKQWVFQPTYLNGDPVEVATEIIVDFTLQ